MKNIFIYLLFLVPTYGFGQLELSSGHAWSSQENTRGVVLMAGYEFKIKDRWFIKTQADFKYLDEQSSFYFGSGPREFMTRIWTLHQSLSYEIVQSKYYIFKPHIGLNYRFYDIKGSSTGYYWRDNPKLEYTISLRNQSFTLTNYDNRRHGHIQVHNLGYSFQLQNQFRIDDDVWLHITPFLEPDYDGLQIIGGFYMGLVIKNL